MSAPYTFTWQENPPIRILQGNDQRDRGAYDQYVRAIALNIANYSVGLAGPAPGAVASFPRSLAPENIRAADTMCHLLGDHTLGDDEVCFVYLLQGCPVALLVLDGPYVCYLLVHPGAENGGAIMVEFAVNYLVVPGQAPPRLRLHALTTDTVASYLGMGFESDEDYEQAMTLDLRRPHPKWRRQNAGWRYISSSGGGNRYLCAAPRPAPRK